MELRSCQCIVFETFTFQFPYNQHIIIIYVSRDLRKRAITRVCCFMRPTLFPLLIPLFSFWKLDLSLFIIFFFWKWFSPQNTSCPLYEKWHNLVIFHNRIYSFHLPEKCGIFLVLTWSDNATLILKFLLTEWMELL